MAAEKIDITKLSDTEIAQMFSDYVGRMEDKERHTEAACKEVDAFDLCCSSEFPNNVRVQNLMYEKMMDTAIEFEESGFIAGFKTAMALLSGQEELLPVPTNISSPEPEKSQHEAVNAPKVELTKYIDTTQIAEMFGRTNFKTCRTIRESILPYLEEKDRNGFVETTIRSPKKKEQTIYKLSFSACRQFLSYMEDRTHFTNIKEGIEIFKKAMQDTFCTACAA